MPRVLLLRDSQQHLRIFFEKLAISKFQPLFTTRDLYENDICVLIVQFFPLKLVLLSEQLH